MTLAETISRGSMGLTVRVKSLLSHHNGSDGGTSRIDGRRSSNPNTAGGRQKINNSSDGEDKSLAVSDNGNHTNHANDGKENGDDDKVTGNQSISQSGPAEEDTQTAAGQEAEISMGTQPASPSPTPSHEDTQETPTTQTTIATQTSSQTQTSDQASSQTSTRTQSTQTEADTSIPALSPSPSLTSPNTEESNDEMFLRLKREALEVIKREPILSIILSKVGLLPPNALPTDPTSTLFLLSSPYSSSTHPPCPPSLATSFEDVISRIVSHRLTSCSGGTENVCPKFVRHLIHDAFLSSELEMGHSMTEAVREDAMAILRRDPACETLLEAVLFMKGFAALVIHRAARRAWKPFPKADQTEDTPKIESSPSNSQDDSTQTPHSVQGTRFVALLLQSQASSAFGVDIHPAAQIGAGVMIDHATGVVIGETATVGDGCTILHGVTLGGTGKESGDRHPKVGNDVLIGAGTKILGNIRVGDRAKIGAGSVVLRPIPSGATAVGSPARIIGITPKGERPGSAVDLTLMGVEPLTGKKKDSISSISEETAATLSTTISGEGDSESPTDDASSNEKGGPQQNPKTSADKKAVHVQSVLQKTSKKDEEEDDQLTGDEDESTYEKESGDDKPSSDDEDSDDAMSDSLMDDYGQPAKRCWVKPPKCNSSIDPFRHTFHKGCCPNSLSKEQLESLLAQQGCTEGEIVEVYFALLQRVPMCSKARRSGRIPLDIFAKHFESIALELTTMDKETCEAIVEGDMKKMGMCKKASRRFKDVFVKLEKNQSKRIQKCVTRSFARLGSTGSLTGSRP